MLLLKYLLLLAVWGLLAAAANVFGNLYQVVQYHRQLRPIAPGSLSGISSGPAGTPAGGAINPWQARGKTASELDLCQWAFPAAWLPLILAAGIVVVPGGMGGDRVGQIAGRAPA